MNPSGDRKKVDAFAWIFRGQLRDWQGWFAAADELQFAAELIQPRVEQWWIGVKEWCDTKVRPREFPALGCHSILMMLYAYVAENLLKGALVRGGRVDLSTAENPVPTLPSDLKEHRLRTLALKAEFECDDRELELLARMQRASVWRGRYPVAARYDENTHSVQLDGRKRQSLAWFAEKDVERMVILIERLRVHVNAVRSYTVARDAAP